MSLLFLKRFFRNPSRVASIAPSSRALIKSVNEKFDHSAPRVIVEYGPGEGCQTREILRRMHPESRLLLFELDAQLATHLRQQFANEPRVTVHNADCARLPEILAESGYAHCDYIVSGIPFSIMEKEKKKEVLANTHRALAHEPHAAFIIYQITNELRVKGHCDHFAYAESDWVFFNMPPNYVTKFYKVKKGANGANGSHGTNGVNGKHATNGAAHVNGNGVHTANGHSTNGAH